MRVDRDPKGAISNEQYVLDYLTTNGPTTETELCFNLPGIPPIALLNILRTKDKIAYMGDDLWSTVKHPQPAEQAPLKSALDYLREGAAIIEERGKLRDTQEGERSMGKAVAAYRAVFGDKLDTETRGWLFMELLKMARMSGGVYHEDDYVDNMNYAALAAESAAREAKV